jgi:hypothetical protein
VRKGAGTGQEALIAGATVARRAGGFAFDVSSLVDSATTASSSSASAPARTLRQAIGLRLGGSLRLVVARLRERANWRSISDRLCQDTRGRVIPPIRAAKLRWTRNRDSYTFTHRVGVYGRGDR